jgi:glucosamine--fructose-6-phosphate aminotransferase (isomerizing)
MCGIIGLFGDDSYDICLLGLKQLQNRGYDSAGICSLLDNEFINIKYASTDAYSAISKLEEHNSDFGKIVPNISIGHTRWATHGAKTDENSHPHISSDGLFSLVHNGIIENYASLKSMLIDEKYDFKSQTDTEVIVNLISYNFKKTNNVEKAIKKTIEMLEGTWGLVIMYKNEKKIYVTRHGSPILIGNDETKAMITSEQSGFCNKVNNYIVLENMDICVIEKEEGKIKITTNQIYDEKEIKEGVITLTPEPYDHWTIKEIHEQPESCLRAISLGGRLMSNDKVRLGGLIENKKELLELDNLILLGCGTSYNAGMIGMNYLKDLGDFNTVQLFDGADFNEKDIPRNGKTGLILLSQSGETKDLHRCINVGRDNNLFLIGVVNVVDSLIAREVNCGCYLNAGREVAVASTKAYTSQVIILSMISIWFAQEKNINYNKRTKYVKDLRNLHVDIRKTIDYNCEFINDELLELFDYHSCFILGKGNGKSIANEGSLKIKEISYIHSEGYSTSSLKHGPFALLHKDFPVILISPDNEHSVKNENAYEEIKSRNAKIVDISTKKDTNKENTLLVEKNTTYQDLLCIIPLQILAYKLSLRRNLNPDMPRNLAKVVTVE